MSGAGLGYGIGDRLAAIFERDLGATAGPEYGKYYGRYADLVRHIADFEEAFGGESDWKVVYEAASGFYCRYPRHALREHHARSVPFHRRET